MGEIEKEALKQRLIVQDPNGVDPLTVRLMSDGVYELVDGEHRWRIAQELGWANIDVFVLDLANDLEAKARCISASKLRGHTDWFKLAGVLKQDFETGVNLTEAYKDILSEKEVEELFSLDTLVPKARLYLEEAVKKFPSITLYDLHVLAQFPPHLQEELSEEYKTHPISSHALVQTLNKYIKQTQPTTPLTPTTTITTTTAKSYLSSEEVKNQKALLEKFDRPISPNDALRILNILKQQQQNQNTTATPEATQTKISNNFDLEPYDSLSENASLADAKSVDESAILDIVQKALLSSGDYYCECGRLHRAHFKDRIYLKNLDIVMQKENMIFEHVDFRPRAFLVHCDCCNSDVEVRVDDAVDEKVSIVCRYCVPAREGVLDVTSGDAVWFG